MGRLARKVDSTLVEFVAGRARLFEIFQVDRAWKVIPDPNQTNLNLVNSGGDLLYEGEIVDYRITPTTATADITAAQNRLTITINVRFTNKNKETDNFEKKFSFFYNYSGTDQLVGSKLTEALDEIFERITQDIFNESLAKW